jgi:hypothetical protein
MIDAHDIKSGDFSVVLGQIGDRITAVSEALTLSASENPEYFGPDTLNGLGLILAEAVADLETIGARLYGDGRTADPIRCTAAPAVVENLESSTGL